METTAAPDPLILPWLVAHARVVRLCCGACVPTQIKQERTLEQTQDTMLATANKLAEQIARYEAAKAARRVFPSLPPLTRRASLAGGYMLQKRGKQFSLVSQILKQPLMALNMVASCALRKKAWDCFHTLAPNTKPCDIYLQAHDKKHSK